MELSKHLDVPIFNLSPLLQRATGLLREAARKPHLLMIDEPTHDLAEYDAFALLALIQKIAQQSSVLVVLHNQRQARSIANQVALLAGGRIQEAASVDSFFENPRSSVTQQFIQTGSCAVAAPDADPAVLADDAVHPPPLPPAALAALSVLAQTSTKIMMPKTQETAPVLAINPSVEFAVKSVQPFQNRGVPEHLTIQTPAYTNVASAALGPRDFTWVIPGRLAGAPMPGVMFDIDYDLQALKKVGITCLITLTERDLPQEPLRRHGLTNLYLPIRDRESPSIAQINMLLHRMDKLLRNGEVLAVHCLAGLGRTGTILTAWLIREGLTAEEALRRIRKIEPKFVQSKVQEEFLFQYEQSILQKI